MCGPMMGIVGGAISAMGSIMQGNAQAASLKSQAKFEQRQASAEYMKGSQDIAMQRRQEARIIGTQQAEYSARGILPGEGTPQEVAKATDKEAEMDRQSIRFGRDLTVGNYEYKAKIDLMNAKQAQIAGMFGAMSSLVNAGTSLGGSFNMA